MQIQNIQERFKQRYEPPGIRAQDLSLCWGMCRPTLIGALSGFILE